MEVALYHLSHHGLILYDEDEHRIFFKFTAYIFAIAPVLALAGIWSGALIARQIRGLPRGR